MSNFISIYSVSSHFHLSRWIARCQDRGADGVELGMGFNVLG